MPALITPFSDGGDIDADAHASNVALLSSRDVEGFLIAGSTGEGPYLEPGERRTLVALAREAATGAYLMCGLSAESLRAAIAQIHEAAEGGADAVLVPTIPTTLSLRTYKQIRRFFKQQQLNPQKVMSFFSMVDRRKLLHRQIVDNPPDYMDDLLEANIPYNSLVEMMGVERAPLVDFAANSPAARCYEALWADIKQQIPPK